ncbi:hypothetical protein HPB48_022362 [Haemaphysalis longicornis]|uniref:Uncharacterized protein n=1 Tax=Haemaphysalis longicornis TaxID=44386 RepID=A0A9J6GRG7_HAELO|nr:hypothetical protein HPB48_022362 [Haemaphysalis longicornis]
MCAWQRSRRKAPTRLATSEIAPTPKKRSIITKRQPFFFTSAIVEVVLHSSHPRFYGSNSTNFRYVAYKDGHKAIVAVSLIRNYAPSSLTDVQKDKDAYWRSRESEDEGFYPADVLELGGYFCKRCGCKGASCKQKKMQRLRQNSTSSSDDDSVVPRALLLDEQQKSAALRRKLATVRQEYHELQVRHNSLQDRHSKLEYVLLHKLAVGMAAIEEEGLVVRQELTKAVWGVANLRGRSVTGAPCRRFLNSKEPGTVPKKRALTPRKLHAVASECLCWDILFLLSAY